MKVTSRIKGVEIGGEQADGMTRMTQVMACSCGAAEIFRPSGKPFPEEALFKMARAKGWAPCKKGRHLCPKCQTKETPVTAPREMQPSDSRRIFRRLDEVYDEANSRYVDGHTDHTIAKELVVPRKWVEEVRDRDFGPSGANDEMERVASTIGRLHHEYSELAKKALSLAEEAEAKGSQLEKLKGDLLGIKEAVGPRRVA